MLKRTLGLRTPQFGGRHFDDTKAVALFPHVGHVISPGSAFVDVWHTWEGHAPSPVNFGKTAGPCVVANGDRLLCLNLDGSAVLVSSARSYHQIAPLAFGFAAYDLADRSNCVDDR